MSLEVLFRFSDNLTSEQTVKIIDEIADGPLTAKELVERSGVPLSTCYRNIKELDRSGWVDVSREQGGNWAKQYTLSDKFYDDLETFYERYEDNMPDDNQDGGLMEDWPDVDQ